MDERLRKMNQLFEEIVDLPLPERAERLDRECDGDEQLRAEMHALLAAHDGSARTSTVRGGSTVPDDADPAPGRIGPYRVSHRLGAGGMGVVYLGTRDDDGRRAALKVVKRGMDTEAILRRFRLERQLLAVLNHPNVARFFEGGETDDGRPYFATEFIDGLPLDEYCDTHRLTIAERLRLFRKVCDAVQYAHQNLIVHRDLKPSNILVTESGEPKLLDFGIAKLLQPGLMPIGGAPTAPDMQAMTPEYASPEQVRGHPVTTASDIYSLGVLLFELVSGHRPYEIKTRVMAEIERVVCEQEPARPSELIAQTIEVHNLSEGGGTTTITPDTVSRARESRPDQLRRILAGDIDNIVLKAMRKEPQRRYATAEMLSDDLRRHLEGLPVAARGDTFTYRCSKFVGRNRMAVAASIGFLLLLLAGIAGTTSGWQAEATARQRADLRFEQVRELARIFMYEFHDSIRRVEGTLPARQMLVEKALEYLDAISADVGANPQLDAEIADAFERIGDIRGGKTTSEMGDTAGALENYRAALEIREALLAGAPGHPERMETIAGCLKRIGDVQMRMGETTAAAATYERGRVLAAQLARDDPEHRRLLMVHLMNVGRAANRLGHLAEARSDFARALELSQLLAREQGGQPSRSVSVAHLRVAETADAAGNHQTALEHYLQGIEIRRRLLDRDPNSSRRRDLAIAQMFACRALLELGGAPEGLPHADAAVSALEEQISADAEDARLKRTLAAVLEIRGKTHLALQDRASARADFQRMQSIMFGLSESDALNTFNRELLALSFQGLAQTHDAMGSPDQALSAYRAALEIAEDLAARSPEDRRALQELAAMRSALGEVAHGLRLAEAEQWIESARVVYADLMTSMAEYAAIRRGYAQTLCRLAIVGATNTARAHLDRALVVLGPGSVHADVVIRERIEAEQQRLGSDR